jgi:hypothetical protein
MRTFLTITDTAALARATFPSRRPVALTRLAGGTVKGVYRLEFDDGFRCLVYRWHPDESYWPTRVVIDVGPFAGHTGRTEFARNHELLSGLGVRVPALFGLDPDRDLVLVEEVRGGSLEQLLARDPAAGRVTLDRLGQALRAMHTDIGTDFGFPGHTSEEFVLRRARLALDWAAPRVPRLKTRKDQLEYELSARHEAIPPRSEYGLIHGEIGPDHVLIDDSGEPVLIDIEGTRRFDVEWEHAFLELRFGDHYPPLRTVELDQHRMRLYRLAHYLSLVAGPLQLLDGDFPRRELAQNIVNWNIERTLNELLPT